MRAIEVRSQSGLENPRKGGRGGILIKALQSDLGTTPLIVFGNDDRSGRKDASRHGYINPPKPLNAASKACKERNTCCLLLAQASLYLIVKFWPGRSD